MIIMKQFFCAILFTMGTLAAFGQQLGNAECKNKDKIKASVEAAASLGRFIRELQASNSTDAWDDFMARASKGGQLSSFDAFGANASQWRNDYINRAAVMDAAMTDYLRSIGADGVKITETILAKVNSDLACFFSDTLLNDLNTLIERSGVPQPMRAAGPCETLMQRCMTRAENTYNEQAYQCTAGAVGTSGWWGAGLGLFCLGIVGQQHFNAIMSCARDYVRCKDQPAN